MATVIKGTIGRPGIGGEFLEPYYVGNGYVELQRYKLINMHRTERRQLKVDAIPATAMVDDLISCIEGIMDDCGNVVELDSRGLTGNGNGLTLRDRLMELVERE